MGIKQIKQIKLSRQKNDERLNRYLDQAEDQVKFMTRLWKQDRVKFVKGDFEALLRDIQNAQRVLNS